MHIFDPTTFAPAIADLLRAERLPPLGPGRPDETMRPRLEALRGEAVFAPQRVRDRAMADACRAGLWLWFDFLDQAHEISQELSTVEGSYWHALMHRREPDHSNAAYWFRRVGAHPIFADLAKAAVELGYRGTETCWDPFAFNDQCEEHRGKGDEMEETLRRVQRVEWQLLFAYCYQRVFVSG